MKRYQNGISMILGLFFILILGLALGYGYSLYEEAIQSDEETIVQIDVEQEKKDSEMEPNFVDLVSPKPQTVNKEQIEQVIFEQVNLLREELGAEAVTRNETLRLAANIRAIETEESFSHTRPDGREPFTVLEEADTYYSYYMVGENLAMATYFRDDEHMAKLIFDGWVDSPGHYKTMINPDFKEIGIGVHYTGEILYITQFFGTSR